MHLSITKILGNGIRPIIKKKVEQTHTLDNDFNAISVFIFQKSIKY